MGLYDNPGASVVPGRKTVTSAGTAEALSSTNTSVREIIITAETDNTGIIAVGDSSVVASLSTRTGLPLSAGDTAVLDVGNLGSTYIDATVSGDGVTYLAVLA